MGGMQALQWGIEYPRFVRRVLAMATTSRESAQAIAFNEVGRQAIMQDPAWNRGDYPKDGGPRTGLAIARMMAHITYVSDASMDRKVRPAARKPSAKAGAPTPSTCSSRSRATCATRARASSTGSTPTPTSTSRARSTSSTSPRLRLARAAFAPVEAETLVVGFTSDWLFPPEQNRTIALALLRAGKRATYAELDHRPRPRLLPPRVRGPLRPRPRLPRTRPALCVRLRDLRRGCPAGEPRNTPKTRNENHGAACPFASWLLCVSCISW
jgi:homoserine O-acetyltransferase